MGNKTPLFDCHVEMGGRIVDFGGWEMPVHYGSQLDEHHAVRREAGMFDVSHMTVVDLNGSRTRAFLQHLLANDVAKLKLPGKALYSCMLADDGGILDDLIVYFFDDDNYRMVVNAATREKDLAWISRHAASFDVQVRERDDLAMIAVQGPQARKRAAALLPEEFRDASMDLKPFVGAALGEFFVARTGYTGEDGWEILLPAERATRFWKDLAQAGVVACGLGARDTLRLEAGMNLYGTDMDESTTPLESGLAWTIAWQGADGEERQFVGADALRKQKAAGVARKFVGLVLKDRGVLRGHQRIMVDGEADGETTSGTYSPTLECSIGMGRVPVATGANCMVEIRGRELAARVVKPPFVRNGKACIEV